MILSYVKADSYNYPSQFTIVIAPFPPVLGTTIFSLQCDILDHVIVPSSVSLQAHRLLGINACINIFVYILSLYSTHAIILFSQNTHAYNIPPPSHFLPVLYSIWQTVSFLWVMNHTELHGPKSVNLTNGLIAVKDNTDRTLKDQTLFCKELTSS